ncbi:MAG: hypothetical protein CMG74_05395 [Candidatus Marinimicrobia bacterium]|nr:hypothetical protein [Candidatus Neomarinimicrobiota bacterium]|tara:strand:+ start:5526 stop:5975 length:450 start_codon:yes stop_codon:yes gene_type:complete
MVFHKKDFLIQIHLCIIMLATGTVYCDSTKYADNKIIILLKQHFNSLQKGPTYLGQSIYEDNNQRIFQLEISSSEEKINENLISSFEFLSKINFYARNPYKKFLLIIHIDKYNIPVIASSKSKCCEEFFINNAMTEKQWKDECLILKTL